MPIDAPDPLPFYSFLPWARQGIASRIDQVDNLGAVPATGPAGRATLTATLTVESVPVPGAAAAGPTSISQAISLVGPGDVKAFKPDVVLRTAPVSGSLNATPGELAFVEFYDEDFPWRYTPARATGDHQLRPWLTLLVLRDDEFTLLPRPGQPAIVVVSDEAVLPQVTETWAWAHVQATGSLADAAGLDAYVSGAPDHALARLMSPRRLRPQQGYHAFVVPTFESGRLSGLGTPDPTVLAQQSSWGSGQARRFPVLYDWAWRTGVASDFESLARLPRPLVVGDAFGKRPLDVSDPGAGLPVVAGATVQLEGALQPIGTSRVDFPTSPGSSLVDGLQGLVDLAVDFRTADPATLPDDPVVTPPAYARQPAGVSRVGDAAVVPEVAWLAELNLDPRSRAAAGLGAAIVRQRDDELMERAWAQVDALAAVNQRLREADLAIAAVERVFAKHIAGVGDDRVLVLTAAAQSAIAPARTVGLTAAAADGLTVRGQVDASRVPAAVQAPAFRRIAGPQRQLVKQLTTSAAGLQGGLINRLNAEVGTGLAVSTAPPKPDPVLGVGLDLITGAVTQAANQQAADPIRPPNLFLSLAHDEVDARLKGAGPIIVSGAELPALVQSLSARLDGAVPPPGDTAGAALRAGVLQIITSIVQLDPDGADQAVIQLSADVFKARFGPAYDGKTYRGVTAGPVGSAFVNVATTTDVANVATFKGALAGFTQVVVDRPAPGPATALQGPDSLAQQVVEQLKPVATLPARLGTVLGGVGDLTADLARSRRLRPVLAYPRFDDPLFEPLRQISQDFILPNVTDLPPETIAVMQPNPRFIESVMAGASTELARELLWNEYPTDQRGTYFSRFWDSRDAGAVDPPADIADLNLWSGALGQQSGPSQGLLVLVMRAELLVKFPNTIVFAQSAMFVDASHQTRTLDPNGTVLYPVLRGHLDPDISLYGFRDLSPAQARGATDAGYFFCFMERPGQIRFGLDLNQPPPALSSWDDLSWGHLQPADAEQVLVAPNQALTPTTPGLPPWGLTSAHLASILSQSPALLARHGTDMIPAPRLA